MSQFHDCFRISGVSQRKESPLKSNALQKWTALAFAAVAILCPSANAQVRMGVPLSNPPDFARFEENRMIVFQYLRLTGKLTNPSDDDVMATAALFDPDINRSNIDQFKLRRYLDVWRPKVISLAAAPTPAEFYADDVLYTELGPYDFKTHSFHVTIAAQQGNFGGEHLTYGKTAGKEQFGYSSARQPWAAGFWSTNSYSINSMVVFSNIHAPIKFELALSEKDAEEFLDRIRQINEKKPGCTNCFSYRYTLEPPTSAEQLSGRTTFWVPITINEVYCKLKRIEISMKDFSGKVSMPIATLDIP